MALIKIEFKFGENNFDKNLIRLFGFIYAVHRMNLWNWKKECKKKKPKLLNFRLVRFCFIFSLSIIAAITFFGVISLFGKWDIFGQILLLAILASVASLIVFAVILGIVYLFYFFFKFVIALTKTIIFIISACNQALKKRRHD